MARKVSVKKVRRLINRFAQEEGIGEYAPYLAAQIEQESGFQTNLGSPAGARDIAQFMPATAKSYGVTLGDNRIKDDLRGQARMMAKLIKQTGNIEDALRGYNAGPGAIEASKGYSETNHYVDVITSNAKKYRTGNQGSGATLNSGGSKSRYGQPSFTSTPGVDNSGLRASLKQQYLADRGKPDALLSLGLSLRDAGDVAPTTTLTPGGRQDSVANPSRGGNGETRNPTSYRAAKGQIIGTPYAGTHSLGNWQSDNAVDVSVPVGSKIRAPRNGVIEKVAGSYGDGSSRFDGYQITMRTNGGKRVFLTHLSKAQVKVGQKVRAGQVIGKGGAANGVAHLHLGVDKGDPRKFAG